MVQEVRPTVFVGVPRVWEKVKDHIDALSREATGIKETIMTKARVSSLWHRSCDYHVM